MSNSEKRLEIRNAVTSLNDLASSVVTECHAKCIPKPRDGDLSIAEITCLDRCVPKYMETLNLVSQEIQSARTKAAQVTVPKK